MAKTILGIDIGADRLKLALIKGNKIKSTATADVPDNIIKDGHIVSIETMAEVIRDTIKANKIHAKNAAIVLPGDNVYVRNITMPQMTHEQLLYNIQYEFKDYITSESKDYIFDYAMISTKEEMEASKAKAAEEKDDKDPFAINNDYDDFTGASMSLTAVVAPRQLIADMSDMLRKAGLKLVKALPPAAAYSNLIRMSMQNNKELPEEICFIDMGFHSIRLHMFKGDSHNVTRVLEVGVESVELVIAEKYNVDIHLAHTYLLNNFEDCQHCDECKNAYDNIAVELMRVLNFYQFSNPDSKIEDVWMCGGGSAIAPLREAIGNTINLAIHPGAEFFARPEDPEEINYMIGAVGCAID